MTIKDLDFIFDHLEKLTHIKCTEQEKKDVADHFKPHKLKKNDFFLKEGEQPSRLAFTVSGLLRSYYINKLGDDFTKKFYFEGSIVGYSALIVNQKASYYIEALENCTLLSTTYSSFQKMSQHNPTWINIIKELQDQTIIYKENRESSFLLEDATQRYIHLTQTHPDIEQRIKQKYIASYLGISAVSLSRIRNKLRTLHM
ncbi:Crp/Fnr family transcriptional regulator [Paenibacillus pedocola]|uniref:Crp/Fnr family transcriptional regulator n=1 Tax=Paenibacillus pedocola TaxID=3242193 RepID=UPI002877A8BD|nr:Crp/Fnr family transcriptional regulator [Paenibacillus typhae]